MRVLELQKALQRMDRKGYWLLTRAQLRILFPEETPASLRESLARHVKSGVLLRVAHALYANPLARSRNAYPLEAMVSYLRPLELNYVSAETALSERGVISQMTQNYLTVMTTGPSHTYETPFGTIEFTHTKRSVAELREQVNFDPKRKIFVADVQRAYGDLKRLGRNTGMIDNEELEEQLGYG